MEPVMDLMNTLPGLFGLVIFVMCAIGGAMMMEAMVGTLVLCGCLDLKIRNLFSWNRYYEEFLEKWILSRHSVIFVYSLVCLDR